MNKLGTGPRKLVGANQAAKRKLRRGPLSQQIAAKNRAPAEADRESSAGSSSEDDYSDSEDEGTEGYKKGGYHPVKIGEKYKNGRYTVLRKLGWGHFSTVWLVRDADTGREAALKVQKSAQHYTEAAKDEVTLLKQISDGDPSDERHCVHLFDSFEHSGPHGRHVCMVFEVLGDNLLSLIKQYKYRGIPLPVVRSLTRQVLVALDYLHAKCSIIHTDLKPENVMLTEAIRPHKWLQPVDLAGTSKAAAPAPPITPAGSSDCPAGSKAGQSTGGAALTKNQKKKMKRKQKKAGQADSDATTDSAVCEATADVRGEVSSAPASDTPAEATLRPNAADASQPAQPDAARQTQQPQVEDTAHTARNADREAGSRRHDYQHDEEVETVADLAERLARARCKIVDFGNACWTYKQFTTDIQTRQYRCPEVLLGAKYSTPADMWSLACMVFELITGDLLFDPRTGKDYERDEDHLALFMELLGKMPRRVATSGKYAKDFFNRQGDLRHIKKLRFWPLDRVLAEKYSLPEDEAQSLASFLTPMLDFVPEKRATAAQMLKHPWLDGCQPAPRRTGQQAASRPAAAGSNRHHARSHTRSASPRSTKRSSLAQPVLPARPPAPHIAAACFKKRQLLNVRSPSPPTPDVRDAQASASSGVIFISTQAISPATSMHSSGVLLSPRSADGLSQSTVLVHKGDVTSAHSTPRAPHTPGSKQRNSVDGVDTDGGWQLL
ncbi:hypothetical protein WJX72_005262 [[Myrmecia] bisecta]|uniref:non-specific serine/threonine protein kinase n=1 Tax=[Myrmecia] bisecta TaxID=41462 RepID=A0AAW1R723_9CHLO